MVTEPEPRQPARAAGPYGPRRVKNSARPCSICGDDEPSHVHHNGQRIEDYFTVGRGQSDFDAALLWQQRYFSAKREAEAADASGLRAALSTLAAARMPRVFAEGPPEMAGAWSRGKADVLEALAALAAGRDPAGECTADNPHAECRYGNGPEWGTLWVCYRLARPPAAGPDVGEGE